MNPICRAPKENPTAGNPPLSDAVSGIGELIPISQSQVDPLGPEVAGVEAEHGPGLAQAVAEVLVGGDEGGVDGAVDLGAGADDVAPVDEGVADNGSEPRGYQPGE